MKGCQEILRTDCFHVEDARAERGVRQRHHKGDVLEFNLIDVHDGWLIFKLPPSQAAVHPSEESGTHELYLMTDDLDDEIAALKSKVVGVG